MHSPSMRRKHVLLITDDADMQRMIKTPKGLPGIRCVLCRNRQETASAFKDRYPDITVAEPAVTGFKKWEIIPFLLKRQPGLPLVMWIRNGSAEDGAEAVRLGARDACSGDAGSLIRHLRTFIKKTEAMRPGDFQQAGPGLHSLPGLDLRSLVAGMDRIPEKKLYDQVCRYAQALNPGAYVIVTGYDPVQKSIHIRSHSGFQNQVGAIMRWMGRDIRRSVYAIEDMKQAELRSFTSKRLIFFKGGLHALTTRKFPKSACRAVEKALGIGSIYTMGFSWKGRLFGGLSLFLKQGAALQQREQIEIVVNHASAILHRRRTESEIRLSEQKYRRIVEMAHEGILATDADFRVTYVNWRMARLLGYKAEEMTGRIILDFIFPDDRAESEKCMERRRRGISERYDRRMMAKNGSIIWVRISVRPLLNEDRKFTGSLAMISDITERKMAEESLLRSESKFKELFKTQVQGILYQDSEGRIVDCNPAAERILGISKKRMMGKMPENPEWEVLHEDGQPFTSEEYPSAIALRTGQEVNNVVLGIRHGGKKPLRWIVIHCFPHFLAGRKELLGLYSMFEDATERIQSQILLKESERRFRMIVENVNDGFYIHDFQGRILDCNENSCRMLGYAREELLGTNLKNIDSPENTALMPKRMAYLIKHGKLEFDGEHMGKDGNRIPVAVSAKLVSRENRGIVQSFVRDITDRKLAEQALRDSEERFQLFMEHFPGLAYIKDSDTRAVYANRGFLTYLKIPPSDIVGKTNRDIFPAEFAEQMTSDDLRILASGQGEEIEENYNSQTWSSIKFTIPREGRLPLLGGFTLNITDRKKAEEALRISERQLRATLDHTPHVAVQWYDEQGRVVYWNPASEAYYGWKSEEAVGKTLDQLILTREEAAGFLGILQAVRERGKPYGPYEAAVRRRDGREGVVASTTFEIPSGGEKPLFVCMDVDITESKQAETALRESEEKYRHIIQELPMGIHLYELTADGRLVFTGANPAADRILGIDNSQFVGKTIGEAFPGLAGTEVEGQYRRIAALGGTWQDEQLEYDSGGIKGAFEVHAFQTSPGRAAALFMDVTERKRASEALRMKTEELDQFFNASLDLLCIANTDGIFIRLNPEWEKTLGYPLGELEGRRFLDLIHPEDVAPSMEAISELASQRELLNFTNRYRHRNGSYRWLEWRSMPAGKLIYAAARDITDRKRTEEALRQSNRKLESIFRSAPIGIGLVSNRIILQVNEQICAMTGYAREELVGRSARMLYPTEEDFEFVGREKYEQIRKRGIGAVETRWRRKNGDVIDIWLSSTPLNPGDLSEGVTFTALDITERKETEEKIRTSLREKDILLQEVHHRVKNNLQVIISLLNLQSNRIKDTQIQAMFKESRSRIRSIALVHEKLYQSSDLSKIGFGEYIQTLTQELFHVYNLSDQVVLKLDIADLSVGLDTAIPLGIVLNELLTNAIKHGFQADGSGTIEVSLRPAAAPFFELRISNNGVPLPDEIDFGKTETLGLQLVKMLVEDQMNGTVAIKRNGGTTFIIQFKGLE